VLGASRRLGAAGKLLPSRPGERGSPCGKRRHDVDHRPRRTAERSAARLAHQSGGLGVASSNLAAPTKEIKGLSAVQTADVSPEIRLGKHMGSD
jgi:hypothetical protein